MNDTKNTWTDVTNRALDLLFTKHPVRTSIGVVLGLVFAFLVELFMPALKTVTFANFAGVPKWGWIPVGILVAHVPTVLAFVMTKPISNETIEEIVTLIEQANFSKGEKRQQYRLLISKVSENMTLKQLAAQEIRAAESGLAAAIKRERGN